ncbi:Hsp70 family protein [Cumulibacter soli]|uniref:Hsp70 family protein n=1 Tax=Cumulibacter soli TaxID=2546344 RepID=UPI00106825B3|nr:Hsp70 family protein [Cumulibacter soli]
MHLGVDFGTTRTIVAYVDRGNYPVVSFFDSNGDAHDHVPAVVALEHDRLRFGFAAVQAAAGGAPTLRSFKRLLARGDVHADSPVTIGARSFPLMVILTGYLRAVLESLRTASSIEDAMSGAVSPDAVIAVPAHAHTAQRFLTMEAFTQAGFTVTGVLNEPSAAGFEYTHRQSRTLNSRRTRVVVYDLGGGTFDASLVAVRDGRHEVIESLGVNDLGGDDFDLLLARTAAHATQRVLEEMQPRARTELIDACRAAKEQVTPQSRRLGVDVAGRHITVALEDFYQDAAPLINQSLDTLEDLISTTGGTGELAGIYLVGGASSLPAIPRVLRARYPRRVHRSPYPTASTAIGLAIAADGESGFSLADRLSRGFGVFRESEDGRRIAFDPIFDRSTRISPDVVVERQYRAAHNVGWFRYVEYSGVDQQAHPAGDLSPYAEVLFPFAAELREHHDLSRVRVERCDNGPWIRERYALDSNGIVSVNICDVDTGHQLDVVLAADRTATARSRSYQEA